MENDVIFLVIKVLRLFFVVFLFINLGVASNADEQSSLSASSAIERLLDGSGHDEESKTCCKKCRKGLACGDSCISKKKTCTKPKGCACQIK